MHTFIDFPHLGIHLENVGKTITLFGIDIAYYGITIAIGMLAGIFVATQVAKRTGQKQDDYVDLAIFGIIFGVIGARIYFVIFSWDMYKDNLLENLQYPARRTGYLWRGDRGGNHRICGGSCEKDSGGPDAGYRWLRTDHRPDESADGAIFLTGRPLASIQTASLPCGFRWTRSGAGM